LDIWILFSTRFLNFYFNFYCFILKGFLTGLLQNFARKKTIAIDTVSFSFPIMNLNEKELKKAEDGAYVNGIFLEGARYDQQKGIVSESKPKELFTKLPIIWLRPEENRPKPTNIYRCPCYKILTRAGELSTTGHSTNYVISIELPSNQPQETWVKRGVASFLSLTYN
jgi:dynein heavy chain, axonemal